MKKLILGIIVSIAFLYLSFRGVETERVLAGLKDLRYGYLIPAIVLILLISILRSLRWGIVLSPLEQIDQKTLFPINCIGYMAIILIPMRVGELLRPYLVSTKSQIPMSSALATIFIERVLDILTILGILFFILSISNPPGWLIKTGYSILPLFVLLVLSICLLYFRTEFTLRLLNPVLNRLPQNLRMKIDKLLRRFVDGFHIIASPKRLFWTILLSILIWVFSGFSIYSLFYFYNLEFPIMNAFVVLIVTIIGISLPTAPGFLGNFQFACIMALSIFGLPKSDALAFSMIYYFLGIGLTILLGLVSVPFISISFKEIKRDFSYSQFS